MRIFIDESGTFALPRESGPSMCCVAALAVSDGDVGRLESLHARLVADWRPNGGELKGRQLNERRFHRAYTELGRLDVVPVICAIDMGLQKEADTTAHRLGQAQKLRRSVLAPEYHDSLRADVDALAKRMERLSNQLYVQSFVQTEAVARTLRIATMRYAQTAPETLGSYVWRIDAKGRTVQTCERLWSDLAKPFLQSIFLAHPHAYVDGPGFDYSALDSFHNPDMDAPPEHLRSAVRQRPGEPFQTGDLGQFMRDVEFVNSATSPGVQFADLIASGFCRACNGELEVRGWERLGPLLVKYPLDQPRPQAVQYLSLTPTTKGMRPAREPYGETVLRIERDARDFAVRG